MCTGQSHTIRLEMCIWKVNSFKFDVTHTQLGSVKRIFHLKMKILSSTHPQVVSNLYEFLYSAEHKRIYL